MAEPVMSTWGDRLRDRTQPLQPDDGKYGWAHAILCEALAQPYLQVAELIDPEDPYPPWAPLFDLDTCPEWALPWLAQATGAVLPPHFSPEEARVFIRDVAGHNAGTVSSIRAAVTRTLVPSTPGGTPTVYFRERDGGAYILEIVTVTKETPNPARTLQSILSAKPGAIKLVYRTVAGWDYQAMTAAGGSYATLKTTYTSYRRLADNAPG